MLKRFHDPASKYVVSPLKRGVNVRVGSFCAIDEVLCDVSFSDHSGPFGSAIDDILKVKQCWVM
jgi:hypothetical protein